MVDSIKLDHVALASRHVWEQIYRYGFQLGARWMGGPDDYDLGDENSFYFAQMELEGGTKLEFLEPLAGEESDFVRRFLDRNGPGAHHMTFKVPDLDQSIYAAMAQGYDVVGINRGNEGWQEAFLHPKSSHGIVIQLACQSSDDDGWDTPGALPPPLRRQPPRLDKIVHLVADLDAATKMFGGPLSMTVGDSGENEIGPFSQLTNGPWLIELVSPVGGAAAQWLGTRSGRLLQLEMAIEDPGNIADATAREDGTYELRPEHNQGTRVILKQR
jgi:methylmalonyl-CoA epimerase